MSVDVIRSLTARHHDILERTLNGQPASEIALDLGMATAYLSQIVHSPTFMHELSLRRSRRESSIDDHHAQIQAEAQNIIRQKTLDAAKRLGMIVDNGNDAVAIRAAEAILDRGGLPRVQRTEVLAAQVVLSSKDVALLTETFAMLSEETSDDSLVPTVSDSEAASEAPVDILSRAPGP